MRIAMLITMLMAVLGIVCGVAVLGFSLIRQRLSSPSASPDPRLMQQAERIELLEQELERLKEQADFTERLLSERTGPEPEEQSGEGDR